jgi:20S proteasome alpha/beta subunit
MTLIVGIGCKDGAIIASDSAATDSESNTKQPAIKIKRLNSENILYGGSGDVGLLQKIDEELKAYSPRSNIKNIRQELRKHIIPILRESNSLHAPYPSQGFHMPPVAISLFVGITDTTPWILEIERDGRDTLYTNQEGYFCAIGSGKPLAQALFRSFLYMERTLKTGKVLASRIMCDAISLAAGGLAEPVLMHILKPGQAPEEVGVDEKQSLKDTCELWKQLERDALGQALAPPECKAEAQIPKI